MHGLIPRLFIAFILSTHAFASPAEEARQANVEEDVLGIKEDNSAPVDAGAAAGATNSEEISDSPTTFNGISVPPMKELRGETFDTEVKDGYWYANLLTYFHKTRHLAYVMAPKYGVMSTDLVL